MTDKVQTQTERSAVNEITGLKVNIYKTGSVTYDGQTKERKGGVSISRAGQFQLKLSGSDAVFLLSVLHENAAFIQSEIVAPELAALQKMAAGVIGGGKS